MSRDNVTSPIFRWAGSKRKLIPVLTELVTKWQGKKYIEPFAGSGCLFFAARPESAVLSDLNYELINAYRMIKSRPKYIHRLATEYPSHDGFYYSLRSVNPAMLSRENRAARFVYLNRFCFNGIYRTNSQGEFNVPRGKDTGYIPTLEQFVATASLLDKAELKCCDFEKVGPCIDNDSLVYLDPPYDYSKRIDRGEYGPDSFRAKDLPRIKSFMTKIDRLGAKFIFSYIDVPEIADLKNQWQCKEIEVSRQVASFSEHRKSIKELIFTNIKSA